MDSACILACDIERLCSQYDETWLRLRLRLRVGLRVGLNYQIRVMSTPGSSP